MLRKQDFYERRVWPTWLQHFRETDNRIVFLHGTMGSELHDDTADNTRWIDFGEVFGREVDNLEFRDLTPEGAVDSDGQFIFARSTVNPPVVERPYSSVLRQLNPTAYCFDWREDISVETRMLQRFLQLLDTNQSINFLTHSMGGCLLVSLLASTTEFDDRIGEIVFCAPPFRGALKPLRVIENGDGTPVDALVRDRVVRRSAATMPGLFQMLAAPVDLWPTQVCDQDAIVTGLAYPIRSGESLYRPAAWRNRQRPDLRWTVLRWAEQHHQRMADNLANVVERLGPRIHVLLGLNGKTTCSATRAPKDGEWLLHRVPKPPAGRLSNGDGTVLLQSSILPGLPTDRYRAVIPGERKNTHLAIMDSSALIADVKEIMQGAVPSKLVLWNDFINRIDWSGDQPDREPAWDEGLGNEERQLVRSRTPYSNWGNRLNPKGTLGSPTDAELFAITREATWRVINGDDLHVAAERIAQTPEFLENHIRALLMPALYG